MLLSKNERFLKEYSEFKEKISKIQDEKIKSELQNMLSILAKEVKIIDQNHENIILTKKIPDDLNERREIILSLRKKIERKLLDCKQAGLLN